MYSTRSGLVLGFHGCDDEVTNSVVSQQTFLIKSENNYDWLGPGIYFWEHDPHRALEYITSLKANSQKSRKPIEKPSVVGAVINLGYCLDLMNLECVSIVKQAYNILEEVMRDANVSLPQNRRGGSSQDLLLRNLDCAVIKMVHAERLRSGLKPFDSVRSMFIEGREAYPQSGFNEKNHIQICICNPNCIKGLFIPRLSDDKFGDV